MISQSERDRVEYEVRLKRQRDAESHDKLMFEYGEEKGFERGLEQGRTVGLEQGRLVGELIGRIRFCQEMLGESISVDAELNSLSLEQLRQFADNCQSGLRNRNP